MMNEAGEISASHHASAHGFDRWRSAILGGCPILLKRQVALPGEVSPLGKAGEGG